MRSHHARWLARKALGWIAKHCAHVDGATMVRELFGAEVFQVTEEDPSMPAAWSTFSWVSVWMGPSDRRMVTFHLHGAPTAHEREALAFEAVARAAVYVLRPRFADPSHWLRQLPDEASVVDLIVARLQASVAAARAVQQ